MDKVLGVKEPPDGFTDEEKQILRLVGEHTIESIYAKLPTSRMKFIVAAHFELGYDQEMVGRILNVSQEYISQEIENIRRVLLNKPGLQTPDSKVPYKPRPEKTKVTLEDILRLMWMISLP